MDYLIAKSRKAVDGQRFFRYTLATERKNHKEGERNGNSHHFGAGVFFCFYIAVGVFTASAAVSGRYGLYQSGIGQDGAFPEILAEKETQTLALVAAWSAP